MQKTIIFFGSSGSGKGTQAELLIKYFKEKEGKKVVYIETGREIREFVEEANYTSELVGKVLETGGLLPAFIPIWVWTNHLIRHFTGNEHLILDGVSRRISEAPVMVSALKFYSIDKPIVLSMNVSREWSKQRLLGRGRTDDNEEEIDKRLDWYKKEVAPVLDYFKKNLEYNFIDINGEQSIEDVHKEILEKIS